MDYDQTAFDELLRVTKVFWFDNTNKLAGKKRACAQQTTTGFFGFTVVARISWHPKLIGFVDCNVPCNNPL